MTGQPRGGVDSITFAVAGGRLAGILYYAPGAGPHPAAVLLHGIPGAEKNHDLAYALREAGWHALIVHFRGAWGSGGRYDIPGQVDDARGALAWLLGPDNPHPVDPARLALVGFSLGSRAALMAAAHDERVYAVVSISGFADFSELSLGHDFLEACALVLSGVTPADLARQWASLTNGDQPTDAVARLRCPLLVVHGEADEVVSVAHARQLMAHAKPDADQTLVADADHVFSAQRGELVRAVSGWLTEILSG
jgi:pimeloyl-ACP methyl ester carboxylesterase